MPGTVRIVRHHRSRSCFDTAHILIFSSHRTSHTGRTRTTRTLFLFFVLRQLVNRRIVPEFLLETL